MSRSKMPKRSDIAAWWKRPANECWMCGYGGTDDLERCHIVARCEGGPDDAANLQILCSICHRQSEFWSADAKIKAVNERTEPQ